MIDVSVLSGLGAAYPWLKALHLVCVILWVGPQLVLGLLIYPLRHMAEDRHGEFLSRIAFLINALINVAMLGAFLLGGIMASVFWLGGKGLPAWLWLKIGFVFALSTFHGLLFRQFRRAMRGQHTWSWPRYDLVQVLSLGATFAIVMLVIIKPMGHG